jgi:hypothetical protein
MQEELKALKKLVPEVSTLSKDAIERLLDWKHDVLGTGSKGSTMGV